MQEFSKIVEACACFGVSWTQSFCTDTKRFSITAFSRFVVAEVFQENAKVIEISSSFGMMLSIAVLANRQGF
ncbi:hypothetical protein BBH56_03505 [Spiribacter roseus]|nr:hypothetical protein BBH56_03505 [Spiribacter roseus]